MTAPDSRHESLIRAVRTPAIAIALLFSPVALPFVALPSAVLPAAGVAAAPIGEGLTVTVKITQPPECGPAHDPCNRGHEPSDEDIPTTGIAIHWAVPVAAAVALTAGGAFQLSNRRRAG